MKRLVGQPTSSHGGTGVYRRKGVFDEFPHVRPLRGAVTVGTEDPGRLTPPLEPIA